MAAVANSQQISHFSLTKLSRNNLLKITVVIVIIAERQADTKTKKQFKFKISYTFSSLLPQSPSPLFSLIWRLQYWKVCKLQIPVHSCFLLLLATFIFWQLHKVNRCLARYSLRATTTSQPTSKAPNEPAMDKNANFGLNLVVFGPKIPF